MREDFYSQYFVVEDSHWWFLGRREVVERVLADNLPPSDVPLRILDVGCGTGTMVARLDAFGRAEGIDLDENAIRFCRERGVERVQQVAGIPWPIADESFDVVTCMDVLEHLRDDKELAAEIRRVLRPGGVLVATVPAFPSLWGPQDEISHHFRRYRRGGLEEMLTSVGLCVTRLSYFNTLLFLPIAMIRWMRRLRPSRGPARSDFEMANPGLLNRILSRLFAWEAPLVARFELPVGVSLIAVATKTAPPAAGRAASVQAGAVAKATS